MTKDEYEDFALRYKGCGACFPMYHTLSRFEKMWFSAIQKDVAKLEKEKCELLGIIQAKDEVIEKMKCCENCRHYSHTYGHCYSYDEYQNCKSLSNWRLEE